MLPFLQPCWRLEERLEEERAVLGSVTSCHKMAARYQMKGEVRGEGGLDSVGPAAINTPAGVGLEMNGLVFRVRLLSRRTVPCGLWPGDPLSTWQPQLIQRIQRRDTDRHFTLRPNRRRSFKILARFSSSQEPNHPLLFFFRECIGVLTVENPCAGIKDLWRDIESHQC